jgi:hypothetical protein
MMRAGTGRDYYQKKRDHGRTHSQALIALAPRRVDVLRALLRDNRSWATTAPPLAQALDNNIEIADRALLDHLGRAPVEPAHVDDLVFRRDAASLRFAAVSAGANLPAMGPSTAARRA